MPAENKSINKKTILILGGGFGGVSAAILLERKLRAAGQMQQARIIVVDREDYQLYHPGLYEVATSEEEFTSIKNLKRSVALPFKEILPVGIEFVRGEVEAIDQQGKTVTVSGQKINFDFLVVGLGSVVDCFGNQSLAHYCIHCKTLKDALFLRNEFEMTVQRHRMDLNKKMLRFIIGGGGFSGIEIAGELVNLARIMAWKYNYPPEKLEILIIEGMNQLLPGMPEDLSREIYARLKMLGVEIRLNNLITEVTAGQVKISTGEIVNYDLLVWTGGVRATKAGFTQAVKVDSKDRIGVDQYLQVLGSDSIFAIGDNALIYGDDGRPLPGNATQAIAHGEYVAGVIAARILGREPAPFKAKKFGTIIAVSGKWAALLLPSEFRWYGFFGWLAHRYADFRYFRRLLPTWQAFKLAWFDTELYSRND